MVRIVFNDTGQLVRFLSINDIDYVDVLIKGLQCFFITDSNEAFAMLEFPVSRSASQEDFKFRVHRKLLLSLADGDSIEISCTEGDVTMVFFGGDGALNYHCSFKRQVVSETMYLEKIQAAGKIRGGVCVDGGELSEIHRIAKIRGGLINVDRGVAAVLLNSGARVYRKVSADVSFAMTSTAFECLRKCNSRFYSLADYLIAVNQGFCVAVRKARLNSNEEYGLIASKRFGSKFIAEVNLGNLFHFMSRTKTRLESVVVNVEKEECKVASFGSEFTIPISFTNRQTAPNCVVGQVEFPADLVSVILRNLGGSVFTLKLKKNFMQFEHGDFIVVV